MEKFFLSVILYEEIIEVTLLVNRDEWGLKDRYILISLVFP